MKEHGPRPRGGVRATLLLSTLMPMLGCDDNTLIFLGLGSQTSPASDSGGERDTGGDEIVDSGDHADSSETGDAYGNIYDSDTGFFDSQESGADAGRVEAGPFGAPAPVAELAMAGAEDFKPTLTADMLEIYFLSNRPGGPGSGDVWRAGRANAGDPWGAPNCVLEVSSPYRETSPAVSADGLTLWVGSDRPGGKGGLDIWVSTRPDSKTAWSMPTEVAELSSPGDEIPRPPGQSSLVMPLATAPIPIDASQNDYQTYTAMRVKIGGLWPMPNRLSSIDTAHTDTDGFLTEDGLNIYFSSDRNSFGHQEIFVATRPDLGSPFASFMYLRELSGPGTQDRDPWLSADGHQIFFSSNRSGMLKIYHAVR